MNAARENQTPPVVSPGAGICIAALNDAGELEYSGIFWNLTANANNAHIHGPAPASGNASVAVGASRFTAGPTGAFAGSGTLPAGPGMLSVAQMRTALSYCNVHTTMFGGGEVRGQLDSLVVPASRPLGLALLAVGLLATGVYVHRRRRLTGAAGSR